MMGAMRRRVRLVLIIAASALGVASACASFGVAEMASTPEGGVPLIEAATAPTEDAKPEDAKPEDAQAAPCIPPVFCDDFNRDSVDGAWDDSHKTLGELAIDRTGGRSSLR